MPTPPTTEAELLTRAFALAGLSIGELAQQLGIDCPKDLKRKKGWVGSLLEIALGATAGSKPEQDFAELGIELKTIPINHEGKALETTFVCVAPLIDIQGLSWENSHIRNKLSKILWVPIEGEKHIPLATRKIGMPFIWTPSVAEELQLKTDWEELMEFIALGQLDKLNARYGTVLQLRPKAANSQAKTQGYGKNGELIQTLPRGFYLRTQFTSAILAKHFML